LETLNHRFADRRQDLSYPGRDARFIHAKESASGPIRIRDNSGFVRSENADLRIVQNFIILDLFLHFGFTPHPDWRIRAKNGLRLLGTCSTCDGRYYYTIALIWEIGSDPLKTPAKTGPPVWKSSISPVKVEPHISHAG
jgi:hypothetical protein